METPHCLLPLKNGHYALKLCRHSKGTFCQVARCRNKKKRERKNSHEVFHRSVCNKHRTLLFRYNNPELNAYYALKSHAKSRKILFNLTKEQFHCLVILSGYLEHKGNHRMDLHIDRKDPLEGYTMWNCRVIPCYENSGKDNWFYRPWEGSPEEEPQEDPF